MSIRVIIAGFKGKMGQAACQMVLADPDMDLVAVLDPFESESEWQGIPVFRIRLIWSVLKQMSG